MNDEREGRDDDDHRGCCRDERGDCSGDGNGAAKADFSAEMAEWIEAFDDVVAQEWENAAELLKALRQRGREAGRDGAVRDGDAVPEHDSEAR